MHMIYFSVATVEETTEIESAHNIELQPAQFIHLLNSILFWQMEMDFIAFRSIWLMDSIFFLMHASNEFSKERWKKQTFALTCNTQENKWIAKTGRINYVIPKTDLYLRKCLKNVAQTAK